ncbi:MAG: pyridoxamine 5'-phosphate oxidase family protein [Bacteroidales bacterium]|nr:pyridoxamine 5'-phosphate oxidase family protein [Bacteroidales bacterium]
MRAREISDRKEHVEIIQRCQLCHLAMVNLDGKPYVIPMNFGYQEEVIYLHGNQHGKKIDILKQHPQVCINFTTDHELRYQNEEVACSWSMKYRSVLCYGTVEFITEPEEKIEALHVVMAQYAKGEFKFNAPSIREVNVWKVKVEKFEGRVYGY